MAKPDEMLTCGTAADLLGFTSDYLRRLCRTGKIKADKFGNTWIFTKKAVKDLSRQRNRKEGE